MDAHPDFDDVWAEGLRHELEGVLDVAVNSVPELRARTSGCPDGRCVPRLGARVGLSLRGGVLEVRFPSRLAVPEALARLRDVVLRRVGRGESSGMTIAAEGAGLVMACLVGPVTHW